MIDRQFSGLSIDQLRANLHRVQDEVIGACSAYGRAAESVRIVAVTKYVDAAVARQLVGLGQKALGENRPQVLREKREALADLQPEWHLIGSLQRNKVRLVVPGCLLVHSVDSSKLLAAISDKSLESGVVTSCLLEVNVAADGNKQGFSPTDLVDLGDSGMQLPGIRLCGMMAMSGLGSDARTARQQFETVRTLFDSMREKAPDPAAFCELSMGMSGDFVEAIAAGATLVRIGSRLFQ